jgi:hypothetical protein
MLFRTRMTPLAAAFFPLTPGHLLAYSRRLHRNGGLPSSSGLVIRRGEPRTQQFAGHRIARWHDTRCVTRLRPVAGIFFE